MNKILVIIVGMLALVLGALTFFQHADLVLLRDRIAALEKERDAAQKDEKTARDELQAVRSQLADTKAFLEQKKAEATSVVASAAPGPASAVSAPAPKEDKGPGSGFMEMFKTEEGKKLMRSQASMQVKMMYGGLAKDLKLDPNTGTQVMQLIGERQSALMEASMEAFGQAGADQSALTAKMETMGKEWDEKIKAVLGESGMTQLKSYERTLGDRMMLSMHEQSFSAAGAPLEVAQRDGLLKVLVDERMNTAPSPLDGAGVSEPGKAISAMKDDAKVDNWLKSEEDYQRRVLAGATKVLNPDQINALTEAFKQQTEMQKLGVKMWTGKSK